MSAQEEIESLREDIRAAKSCIADYEHAERVARIRTEEMRKRLKRYEELLAAELSQVKA